MLSKIVGALLRAAIVVLVVSMPSLVLPGTTPEGAELVVLLALVLAAFTVIEYSSSYPALIEFRDAPPAAVVADLDAFCAEHGGQRGA